MLSGRLIVRVLVPAMIALGSTVKVWPATVTYAVEVPVGRAMLDPPI